MAKLISGIVLLCCSMLLCAQQTTDNVAQDTVAQPESELTEGFELLKDSLCRFKTFGAALSRFKPLQAALISLELSPATLSCFRSL